MRANKYNAHVISVNNIPKHVHIGNYSEAWEIMLAMKESLAGQVHSIFVEGVEFGPNNKWWIESVTLSNSNQARKVVIKE